jgi:hypothetical protein
MNNEKTLRRLIREMNEANGAPVTWGELMTLFKPTPAPEAAADATSAVGGANNFSDAGYSPGAAANDDRLNALICGDSQAGGALGAAIKAQLQGLGYDVKVSHRNGASGAQIAADQIPPAGAMPDLVVACFGGNDGSPSNARSAARQIYERVVGSGGFLIAVGPPPATMITNPQLAGKIFPALGEMPNPNAWFELERGAYVDRRIDIAEAIESEIEGRPNAAGYGIAGRAGSSYPDQPDGLHLVNGADSVSRNLLASVGIDQITARLKSAIAARAPQQTQEYTLSATAEEIAKVYPKMRSYVDEIIRVSDVIGIKPNWLANVINFESRGGDPQAVNTSGTKPTYATGLIQFMPFTARGLGTSIDALVVMSGREQMKWVEKYFMPWRGRLDSQEDVYMAVFYPVAIGKPDTWTFPPAVAKANPGIRTPADYARMANRNAKLSV